MPAPKRKAYSVEYKLKVVEELRRSKRPNISQIAAKFGVDRKRVREWNNDYEKLIVIADEQRKSRKKVQFKRRVRSQAIEDGVLRYWKEQQDLGKKVKNKDLQNKALQIADAQGVQKFKASNMWLYRWKGRNNIGTRPDKRQAHRQQKS